MNRTSVLLLFVVLLFHGSTEEKLMKRRKAVIRWILVPDRNMEEGFEPFGNSTSKTPKKQLGRTLVDAMFNFNALAGTNGGADQGAPDEALNRVMSGAATENQGIANIIKNGDTNLGVRFKYLPNETVILLDNRCKSCTNVSLRCVSPTKDTGYFEVNFPNSYILKFPLVPVTPPLISLTVAVGTNPQPHPTKYHLRNTRWVCEFKNIDKGTKIIHDVFGGTAPRALINFYEIREKGVIRLDDKTARIDARQMPSKWKILNYVATTPGTEAPPPPPGEGDY